VLIINNYTRMDSNAFAMAPMKLQSSHLLGCQSLTARVKGHTH